MEATESIRPLPLTLEKEVDRANQPIALLRGRQQLDPSPAGLSHDQERKIGIASQAAEGIQCNPDLLVTGQRVEFLRPLGTGVLQGGPEIALESRHFPPSRFSKTSGT